MKVSSLGAPLGFFSSWDYVQEFQGHRPQYPTPLKSVGLWWPIALLTFENVPAFTFTSVLSWG